MSSPLVSVVVPSRGGAARLPVLLEALAAQEVDAPWETVVVLDGDVDGSRELLARHLARLPLRVVERTGTGGVAAALADGYEAAQGDIIVRCDDDLTPPPHFVQRHLDWHRGRAEGSPPLGVIALTRDVFDDTLYAESYGRPANARLRTAAYERPADQRWMHWAACNSIPRSAYDAVGGFDTTMSYREDSELGLRLARHGVELIIDPALEIEHRCPATSAQERAARAFTSGASTRAFEERHPGALPVPGGTGTWARLVGSGARRLRCREDAASLGRAIDRALPTMPRQARPKAIAWAVETAGEAGRRVGWADWVRVRN